jgi:hypothetical protein
MEGPTFGLGLGGSRTPARYPLDQGTAFLAYDEEHMDLIDPGGSHPGDRGAIGVDHGA